jgi:competence protein ComEC
MRLVYIALGWVAGIALAAGTITLPVTVWAGLAVLLGLIVAVTWREADLRLFNIILLAFALGGLRYAFVPTTSAIAAYNNTGGLTIKGYVIAEPDTRDDRIDLRVRVEQVIRGEQSTQADGLVLVRAPRVTDVHYGDTIRATGSLITPGEFDTFSYADYLAREGVFSIMQNASVTRTSIFSPSYGDLAVSLLNGLRRSAYTVITRHLPEPQAGLLGGMILGDRRGISPQLTDDFAAVGASHLIAISGFNMVILTGVVMGVLTRLMSSRRSVAVIGIGIIVLYTLLVGASPGVVRAAIMSSLLVIAPLLRRRTYVPASLAFAALLMTLHNPTVLWDVSFQLSFAATLGLALFVDPLARWFNTLLAYLFPQRTAERLGRWLEGPLIVSAAAQITTMPLIVLYFERLSLVWLPVNLLVIPVHPVQLLLGGLATGVAAAVPVLGQILYWAEYAVLSWTIGVVRTFAALPFADMEFSIDPRLAFVYFAGMTGWGIMHATQPDWWIRLAAFLRRRAVLAAVVVSGVMMTALMGMVALSRPDGHLHVWFLDVGHSNAVLVQTPGGAQILVDGGRFPSRLLTAIGDRLPFTDHEIAVLVITQPDHFNTSALPAVLARYDTGVVLTNGQPNLSAEHAALQDALAGREVVIVHAGYTLELDDGTLIEVLHPQRQPDLGEPMDDHALTLRLTYRDVSFLLTGDLSRQGQQTLLDAGEWPLATVLQMPQHGAVRSLDVDFLNAVQPQVAVVQSDRANRRGDPNPDTLALLPDDVQVFRTDLGGPVHLWTDGVTLWAAQSGR